MKSKICFQEMASSRPDVILCFSLTKSFTHCFPSPLALPSHNQTPLSSSLTHTFLSSPAVSPSFPPSSSSAHCWRCPLNHTVPTLPHKRWQVLPHLSSPLSPHITALIKVITFRVVLIVSSSLLAHTHTCAPTSTQLPHTRYLSGHCIYTSPNPAMPA